MLASLAAALVSLVLTPITARAARRLQWFDHPDGERKRHVGPIAPSGGTALFCAFLAGAWIAAPAPGLAAVSVAAAVVYSMGLYDDLRGLPPWTKIVIEAGAAAIVVTSGIWRFTPAGAVAAAAWLVLCTNALNLLDGIDGLAASTAAIAAGGMLLMRGGAAGPLAVLVGALAGFLPYNLPPARVFLGDSGSLTLGLLLGAATLWTGGGSLARWTPAAATLVLPLADTAWVAARRWRLGRPIFQADREHFHHRLRDRLGNAWMVLLLLAALDVAVTAGAVAAYRNWFGAHPALW